MEFTFDATTKLPYLYSHAVNFKADSHQAEAEAIAKIFFDVCRLFFDLFCFSFCSTLIWCE